MSAVAGLSFGIIMKGVNMTLKKFNLRQKILIFCTAFVGVFGAFAYNTVTVSANSPVVLSDKSDFTFIPPDYDHVAYPYYAFCRYSGRGGTFYFIVSKSPFTVSNGGAFVSSGGYIGYNTTFISDNCVDFSNLTGSNKASVGGGWENGVFYPTNVLSANHTIKKYDGEIVFLHPLLTEEMVSPIAEDMKANSQVIVCSTICLVGLVVCLVALVMRWRQSLKL